RELLPPPQPDHLAEAWAAVQAKAAKPGFDPEDLRGDILALRARFPGTQPAFRAAELLARLPSPLDQLDAARIPPALRLARQPSELVAVLGEPRNQNWGDIFRLSFRPDGKTLACGASSDKTVRVWDLAGTEPRRAQVISGYGYTANTLAFTPDGLGLSFIGDGCVVRHWDLANNRQQPWAVVLGPSSSTVVTSVAFAPDGKALAYGGEDCTVHLWDLARTESRERAVLRGHTGSVLALAFSPDGQTLASGSADRLVRLWDLTTQPPLERAALKGHHQRIQGLAFTPDGKSLLSCANDSSVRLWDLSTGKEKNVFRVSNNNFVAVTVTADGRRAAASSSGGSVVWWDLTTGTKGGEFQFPSGAWNVAFAPDGRHLAIGNGNGTVYILRLAQRPPLSER
ncbi:MAG: WD40 repeat domain-containing protein, partial [Planctomycetia bacterium]|nr:WD40 repeat domain-containing protein [Planctomycetia bacterium]